MKPANPMAQLEQWKKNNLLKNPQLESHRATKKEALVKTLYRSNMRKLHANLD